MPIAAFRTRLGQIWLHGDPERLKTDAPVVLAIAGVFARPDALWFRLQDRIPEATVLAAQLPGHHCPAFSEISIQAFAQAFGEVIQNQLGGRPLLVVGDSIGGTTALALPNPGIRRLALDPPLQTGHLWPLLTFFERICAAEPATREFLGKIFGFDGQAFAQLDYRPLVIHPSRVLIGEIPLQPPRESDLLPSLLSEEDRQFLKATGLIHSSTVKGIGHVVVWFEDMVIRIIREELEKATKLQERSAPFWKPLKA